MKSNSKTQAMRSLGGISVSICALSFVLFFVGSSAAQTPPVILTQPQGQNAAIGSYVTLSVSVEGSSTLPTVSSGTLQLWLKADTGVVTNGSGLVSRWQDLSSNSNNALQNNSSLEPTLVSAAGLSGRPVVQFNGIQSSVDGSYMFGSNLVNVPNAMTAFTVYNALETTNNENIIWEIGYPDSFGANRVAMVVDQDIYFSFWSFGNTAPFIVPTNTFRVRTDRLDTNMDTIEMFDATATSATNFTQSVDGSVEIPAPGYYLGGLNTSVGGPYVGSSRNFGGQIAETLVYSGYFSETDREAVTTYLLQKYLLGGTNGLTFQWQFDGTNILGATNATLTLTNVQANEAGSYSVIVSNTTGSTSSSNAVLITGIAPSITVQPESQEVAQGTNVNFSVAGSGAGPLSYQWYFDGSPLAQATNSSFSLTNVQPGAGGSYSVTISSPFGSISSTNATLAVDLLPVILTQPQSQIADVGTAVEFSVAIEGSSSLPPVTSGTLQLWLKADSGVSANGAGLVNEWADLSSNSNNAVQTNSSLEPTLVSAGGLNGRPVVQFNGIQSSVDGSYMYGSNLVDVPTAMTSFTVYNALETTNNENIIWEIGYPDSFGANRIAMVVDQDIYFSFWSFGNIAPFAVPTNTFRLRTDRLDTNLDTIEMFDSTANSATNFTQSVNGSVVTPAPGYYLGGLNTSVGGPYVGSSRNFGGQIAEILVYSGYFSEADRQAITGYLMNKYFLGVSNGGSFQWQFDGTNIAGATNATLTLTNLQLAQSGTYTVVVTDSAGAITSSNAILSVGLPPEITTQPQSQEVGQGTNVVLNVAASGNGDLVYQWYFAGAPLAQATNSALSLTNVQATNSGLYAVSITSPFGSVLSSNAVLTVAQFPVILVQPESQGVVIGSSVTLSVGVEGITTLPVVNSGTLQLWLKADAGVVTNGSGLVSQWNDLSSNSNNAVQTNVNLQPRLVSGVGLNGLPSLQFNGIQNNIYGSYMFGSKSVNVPNALTSFTVYNALSDTNSEDIIWDIGIPDAQGANRVAMVNLQDMHFSFWSFDWSAPFLVPTNTFRLRTDRLDTNLDTLEMFDETASTATNFNFSINGGRPPGEGYYLGGLNTNVGQPYVGSPRNFNGDIAEVVVYSGDITEPDRQAVTTYLMQKYFLGVTNGFTFQWQFDGTNIVGATNATLTLTDLQTNQVGNYSVIVTDPAGSVTSSNANLGALFPPTITSSPSNQTVTAGATVTLDASATGTGPLSYQWIFNGVALSGATNTSLTLSNLLAANSGSYSIVVTSPYGSATSAPALLTVDETTVYLVTTNSIITNGSPNSDTIVIPIELNAVGAEAAFGFTLNFNSNLLTFQSVTLGSGAVGDALIINGNQAASGILGLGVDILSGTFAAGTDDVFDVTFQIATVTNWATNTFSFSSSPINQQVSDAGANPLPAVWEAGTLVLAPSELEGDVSPRPNGNEVVTISDWVQEARFVVGLDIVSNGLEFQRADCAPRDNLGDGEITVADWVQVGRYAAGLDAITAVGGPSIPGPALIHHNPIKLGGSRLVSLTPVSQGALTNTVAVQLTAQGDESALGFTVNFDPALMRFVNATLGSGAVGASLAPNTAGASNGVLGFVIGYYPPNAFAAGTETVLNLNFASVNYTNTSALAFVNAPVICQLADTNAVPVSTIFQNGTLTVAGSPWPSLSIGQSGNNLTLSWPVSGTGTVGLQVASSITGPWTDISGVPSTNGETLNVTTSISNSSQFFRLKY